MVKRRYSPTTRGNDSTTPYDYNVHPIITKLNHELQAFEITSFTVNLCNGKAMATRQPGESLVQTFILVIANLIMQEC